MATKQKMQSQSSGPTINNNGKSDTFNIFHYNLYLDLTQVGSNTIRGITTIDFSPKLPTPNPLNLDLLKLNVDSIRWKAPGQNTFQSFTNYSYKDSLLALQVPSTVKLSDTVSVKIFYHGQPQKDASGWGGYHSGQGYYYNLGVGFAANPHTFGRAWFPCYDNFVEKSTYKLKVKSVEPLVPLLTGGTQNVRTISGDTIETSAQLNEPLPTYLVSFALSRYQYLRDTVQGKNDVKDILLAAKASDTSNLKGSFRNLKPTFHAFEDYFGPYDWPRVGYAVTTVGAMEHATSISYPINLVNGNLSGESIMAHELAHHWFGNLVTCQTGEDMWINEGMAEFCSHLYREKVYGRADYLNTVRDNAYNVLNFAHRRDNGYRALYGVPHDYVYGYHVYQKGAMVAHNLRHYLGDAQFFGGLQTLLQQNKFGNLSTTAFRDSLVQITGETALSDFFQNWILDPGFPQFSVDELKVKNAGYNTYEVTIGQRLYEAPHLYDQVPVDVTFFSAAGDTTTQRFTMSNVSQGQFQTDPLPFAPEFALANFSGSLLTASSYDVHQIQGPQFYANNYGGWDFEVTNYADSGRVIAMQHLAGPDQQPNRNFYFRLSGKRYFTIRKLGLKNTKLRATLRFAPSNRGWEDDLLQHGNDSLTLFYRPDGVDEWQIYPHQTKMVGSPNSTVGDIEISPVLAGDYALGNTGSAIGLNEQEKTESGFAVFPNPAAGRIELLIPDFNASKKYQLRVFDLKGQKVLERSVSSAESTLGLDSLAAGSYYFSLNGMVEKVVLR